MLHQPYKLWAMFIGEFSIMLLDLPKPRLWKISILHPLKAVMMEWSIMSDVMMFWIPLKKDVKRLILFSNVLPFLWGCDPSSQHSPFCLSLCVLLSTLRWALPLGWLSDIVLGSPGFGEDLAHVCKLYRGDSGDEFSQGLRFLFSWGLEARSVCLDQKTN